MTSAATQLLRFSQRFRKYCDGQFAPLLAEADLTMREVHVLLFLANNPGYDTARDIVELRGLAKSQVSQAVELLAGRGLLGRTADGADRRVVHLALTEAGAALAARCQAIQAACGRQLLEGLKPEESAQFSRLLAKVFARAEQLAEKERPE